MPKPDRNRIPPPKKARGKQSRSRATVAYYGQDDRFASKVVVGIVLSDGDRKPIALKKWFSKDKDVRKDAEIIADMMKFILEHDPEEVVITDQIIGCPHEEGIDYPPGENCPHCPFWADRGRLSGEIIES